ncbi:MAG: N-acetylmuramoyl-L-alanine amidase [Chloroflexota bacterium]|nr:N-acetylmuramoyl-L-alanine amidase [Chloroflexota bacterium]
MHKRISDLAIAAVLVLSLVLVALPANATGHSVCIDPGHGGSDTGTSGGGILEKDLNLDVALELGTILSTNGYGVFYTRTEDISLGNSARAEYCNSVGATILVSVHHNGASNPDTDYTTALYQKRVDRDLARVVTGSVSTALGIPNKGITQFASGVLIKSDMPATISEGYFLTSTEEQARLSDPDRDYRYEEAQAIYQGIVAYLGSQ